MKANKAPKKVYLHLTTGSRILNGKYYEYKPAKIRFDDKIIEYTRTDAFIEKAETYLKEQFIKDVSILSGGVVNINFSTAIRNFIKYMEEK